MDDPDFFSTLAEEWLNWEGLPGLAVMLAGLVLVFFVPLLFHQRGRQEQEVGRGFAFHFGAELIALIGLLLLFFGLSYYADLPSLVD
ncbi:MAG TPA: hypothetical protein PKM88_02750 [bacterium]|nr:hypothetical protein [bacterium]